MTTDSQRESIRGELTLAFAFFIFLRILQRNSHHPGGDNGGNRMLIDHLADRILEQHDKLIERFDLALQLDTIDQINGNWNPFLT